MDRALTCPALLRSILLGQDHQSRALPRAVELVCRANLLPSDRSGFCIRRCIGNGAATRSTERGLGVSTCSDIHGLVAVAIDGSWGNGCIHSVEVTWRPWFRSVYVAVQPVLKGSRDCQRVTRTVLEKSIVLGAYDVRSRLLCSNHRTGWSIRICIRQSRGIVIDDVDFCRIGAGDDATWRGAVEAGNGRYCEAGVVNHVNGRLHTGTASPKHESTGSVCQSRNGYRRRALGEAVVRSRRRAAGDLSHDRKVRRTRVEFAGIE